MGEVGFSVSFVVEEGTVVIGKKFGNAIEFNKIKENGLDWITEEQLLFLAHVSLDRRTSEGLSGNQWLAWVKRVQPDSNREIWFMMLRTFFLITFLS